MSRRRDVIKETSKFNSLWETFRDFSYDAVFHVGDTAQNFLWDAVYGPSDNRNQKYYSRQIDKHERKSERPLKLEERTIFAKILKRSNGESLIIYWKRQKALLRYPDKLGLVQEYRQKENKITKLKKEHQIVQAKKEIEKLERQFRKIQKLKPQNSKHSLK